LKIYADPSFLVSLYSPDINSQVAARMMRNAKGDHYISVFGELEVVNALQLRIFRKELSTRQAQSSLQAFEHDIRDAILLLRPVSDQVFERARQLSQQTTARLGTRTTDLLHVAAALEMGAAYLYTFDQQQRALAQAVRLKLN
jgi:predicted nucleic acid-binding protein